MKKEWLMFMDIEFIRYVRWCRTYNLKPNDLSNLNYYAKFIGGKHE